VGEQGKRREGKKTRKGKREEKKNDILSSHEYILSVERRKKGRKNQKKKEKIVWISSPLIWEGEGRIQEGKGGKVKNTPSLLPLFFTKQSRKGGKGGKRGSDEMERIPVRASLPPQEREGKGWRLKGEGRGKEGGGG